MIETGLIWDVNYFNWYYPATWVKQIESGQVQLYEDVSTIILLQRLIAKHIDGIDIEPSVLRYYLKELGKPADTCVIDRRYEYQVYSYHFIN